jgi:hypothetical protein
VKILVHGVSAFSDMLAEKFKEHGAEVTRSNGIVFKEPDTGWLDEFTDKPLRVLCQQGKKKAQWKREQKNYKC